MLEQSTRIGEFEIIRLLGKGGMGEVYEARQRHPDRRVALKVLAPWLAENSDALERFWKEAEVPAQLDHPAIVRIISTGKCNGLAYYVMQMVNGISLAKMINCANEPTPATRSYTEAAPEPRTTPGNDATIDAPADASSEDEPPILQQYRVDRYRTLARLGIQAARALAWTHKKGFLHRDIKPSNIMVDHHNQLYLVDFGLTRALDSGLITRTGTLVGTPYYMSPEQAVGQPLDPRSDIFSLGVSLYQLASRGKGPYKSPHDDSDSVLREVRAGVLVPLRSLAADVPALLEKIIQRAINPDPAHRYQKAEELADDLEKFANPAATTAAIDGPMRRGGVPYWAAAIAIVLLAGPPLYLYLAAPFRDRPNPDPPVGEVKPAPPAPVADTPKKKDAPTLRELFKRDRPVKTEVKLVRADHQPTLYKQVLGEPTFSPMTKELILFAKQDGHKPGLLALDDPGVQNFEFAVEVRTWGINPAGKSDLGLFFGWRDLPDDSVERTRFFAVQLDPRPDNLYPHGVLRVGTWMFEPNKGARIGMSEQGIRGLFSPKDGLKGIVPLPAPANERVPYYRVYVRVVDKKISVGVESEQPVEFDVPWLKNNDKWLAPFELDPHGALGIWTRNGQAFFRNPTIMILPKTE